MSKVCIFSCVHNALDNRIFYREARSLHKAGYEVVLFAVYPHEEFRDGIHILPVPRLPRWRRPQLWFSLARRVIETKSDIYHFHDPELLFISPWIRKKTNRPTIYDIHEALADFIEIKDDIPTKARIILAWLFRWLEPQLARLQSGLIFADDQIAQSFQEISLPKTTLFNFPDSEFIDNALRATRNIKQRPPIVLYLGGLKRNRGSQLMLEAFKMVLQEIPQARLILVGPFAPATLEREVRASITRLDMQNNVTLIGEVPFERVSNYLTEAAIGWIPFLPVPKYQKNIPTKLFEYMAYALPVVSSNLQSVQPFIHHGENGYLVTADDPSAHAHAIKEILKNSQKAYDMGRNGQNMVCQNFRWEKMEERLLNLYRPILTSAHRRE
jgi:glycosyltransferase involved in cell wall biosynthesis